jgi:DNA polymerase elongation subunit (family B)
MGTAKRIAIVTAFSGDADAGEVPGDGVPEAGYWVCERRYGIVPATLAPLLEKRRRYKRLKVERLKGANDGATLLQAGEATIQKREPPGAKGDVDRGDIVDAGNESQVPSPPSASRLPNPELAALYDARQKAIKWILVTCFGYLGYRNARFGRIEAHEAVAAFGREKLLQAKELAEARAWRVLHGLTDCLYLAENPQSGMPNANCKMQNGPSSSLVTRHPSPVTSPDDSSASRLTPSASRLRELCNAITQETGVEMAIEGVYRWICFLPSRIRPNVSVPNRFWGVFTDGKVKVRGLLLRKHDTPEVLREAQVKALEYLAQWETLEDARTHRADVEALFERYADPIRGGRLPLEALAFKRRLTRSLEDYRAKTPVSVSLWKLRNAGIRLEAGQFLRYIIVDARAPTLEERYLPLELCADDTPYDVEKYLKLLDDARAEILFYAPTPPKAPPPRSRSRDPVALPLHTNGGPSA